MQTVKRQRLNELSWVFSDEINIQGNEMLTTARPRRNARQSHVVRSGKEGAGGTRLPWSAPPCQSFRFSEAHEKAKAATRLRTDLVGYYFLGSAVMVRYPDRVPSMIEFPTGVIPVRPI